MDAGGEVQDLLTDVDGLGVWLAANGLDGGYFPDTRMLSHVLQARDALKAAVDGSLREGPRSSTPYSGTGVSWSRSPPKDPANCPS